MTVYCERDTQKPGNVCIKCNGTWTAGTPLPACRVANAEAFSAKEIVDDLQRRIDEPSTTAAGVAPNEPTFVLRASDLLADYLVDMWARNAETQGCNAKTVQAAREKAREMRAWPWRHYPT